MKELEATAAGGGGRSLTVGSAWMPPSSVTLGKLANPGVMVPSTVVGIDEA